MNPALTGFYVFFFSLRIFEVARVNMSNLHGGLSASLLHNMLAAVSCLHRARTQEIPIEASSLERSAEQLQSLIKLCTLCSAQ